MSNLFDRGLYEIVSGAEFLCFGKICILRRWAYAAGFSIVILRTCAHNLTFQVSLVRWTYTWPVTPECSGLNKQRNKVIRCLLGYRTNPNEREVRLNFSYFRPCGQGLGARTLLETRYNIFIISNCANRRLGACCVRLGSEFSFALNRRT